MSLKKNGEMILSTTTQLLPQLKVVVPAAVAVWWLFKQTLGKKRKAKPTEKAEEEEEEEPATPIDVSFSNRRGPVLRPPQQLSTPLISLRLPMNTSKLWTALFSNSTSLLADFHKSMGDQNVKLSSWMQRKKDNSKFRSLSYISPLSNPLGPKRAFNKEQITILSLGQGNSFVLQTKCVTKGVPFSSDFANFIQWTATPDGPTSTILKVSAECRFHNQVWGPLKGKVEKESVKGIVKAYKKLQEMLISRLKAQPYPSAADQLAAVGKENKSTTSTTITGKDGAGMTVTVDDDNNSSSSGGRSMTHHLVGAHSNPAVVLMVAMFVIVIWRVLLFESLGGLLLHKYANMGGGGGVGGGGRNNF